MKNLLYILGLFILMTGCRSIEKMVDQGEYDEAIIFATEKLAGKKNKKTKHIQGLEEAFAKINQRDMARINYLNGINRPENWDEIFAIASLIEQRQSRISPFLPLISKEGYIAQFEFIKTDIIKNEAIVGAADYHYREGLRSLGLLETTGKKTYARKAYYQFLEADSRIKNYKDTPELLAQTVELGRVKIFVDVVNQSDAIIPIGFENEVKDITVREMNSLWRSFHINRSEEHTYDYIATLAVTSLDVSPERETIREYRDSKEIKDGWEYKKNKKGKYILDTLGNKIKVDKFITVKAKVTEIQREKVARVIGLLRYTDNNNGELLESKPIDVEAVFIDYASTFRGDRRALSDHNRNRLKNVPLPFPNDLSMIMNASNNLKEIFKLELRQFPI
jgi:hypothetical protein